MTITVIADAMVPVPPPNYGGTERIVHLMCAGLRRRGHLVRLVAAPGSADYGGGLIVHRPPTAAYPSRVIAKLRFQWLALRATRGAEIVINHGRIDYLDVLYRTRKPVIHWCHNPLTGRETGYVLRRRPRGDHFVGVSRAQVSADPHAARFEVIPNAVDPARIPFSPRPAQPPYLLFLGRLTANKGVHLAIEAARRAGAKLIIGGNIPREPGSTEYFETAVKPHLGSTCEWVGPYDEATRENLVAGATALLFPIQWPEPFGIVMLEALAAGVPVIASRLASTPEVIRHGETGFLCDSVDEMVAAIHRVGMLSREACRQDVVQRFGPDTFIARVEALIARALVP